MGISNAQSAISIFPNVAKENAVNCPKCKSKSKVYDSRSRNSTVRRYRKCLSCDHKYQTEEVLIQPVRKEPRPAAPVKPKKRVLKPRPRRTDPLMLDIDSMSDDELMAALEDGSVSPDMLD